MGVVICVESGERCVVQSQGWRWIDLEELWGVGEGHGKAAQRMLDLIFAAPHTCRTHSLADNGHQHTGHSRHRMLVTALSARCAFCFYLNFLKLTVGAVAVGPSGLCYRVLLNEAH